MRRFALIVTLAIFASFIWGTAAFAHGTDLNNVWTTEVCDEGTFEWDLDLGISDEEFGAFWSEDGRFLQNEFYASIFKDFEIGFAFNVEREVGPFIMFCKYRVFNEEEDNFPVSLAVGCDNVMGTHQRFWSEPIPYIVVGKNFDKLNGYVGYAHNASGLQDDSGVFAGFDYQWNEKWLFAVDFYGFNENEDNIISGGVYYDWMKHFNVNTWVSYDSTTENAIVTVELAFTGRFDDLEAEV
jgi:hypothetical protein